jgi:hypothetical protein
MLILPVLVCLIATPLVRKQYRQAKVPPVASLADVPAWIQKLPRNLFLRALAIGLVVSAVVSPGLVGGVSLLGFEQVDVVAYALAKGVICGLVAAVISPPLALRAIADVVGEPAASLVPEAS